MFTALHFFILVNLRNRMEEERRCQNLGWHDNNVSKTIAAKYRSQHSNIKWRMQQQMQSVMLVTHKCLAALFFLTSCCVSPTLLFTKYLQFSNFSFYPWLCSLCLLFLSFILLCLENSVEKNKPYFSNKYKVKTIRELYNYCVKETFDAFCHEYLF